MRKRELVHTTVVIGKSTIARYKPCVRGMADATDAGLFPARVSTDPEQNIDLALRIANIDRIARGAADVWWMAGTIGLRRSRMSSWSHASRSTCPDRERCNDGSRKWWMYPPSDPYVIAQWLAHAADRLAQKAGR